MAALLEVRSLEALDQDLLCEITDFYYNFNPSMQYRMITPYSYAPSDEVIIAISSVHEISLVDNSTDCAISTKAHSKSLKRRSRTRKSSSTDCCNRKESEIETKADIIITECSEEVNKNDLNLSKTESRLKAIINAREKINSDSTSIEYTKLPLKQDVDMSLSSFPELNASQSSKSHLKSPNKLDVKQKLTKLSQKQRKRLSSENSSELHSPTIEEIKNPWKICTTIDGEDEFKEPDPVPMNSIIIDEKKQKEKFVKMKTKLLVYTQVEDKAIEDLYKFYNVENIFDEVITVNRVQLGAVASPVWVPSNKVK